MATPNVGAQYYTPPLAKTPQYQSPYAGLPTDPNNAPIMPEFNSIYNPNTMSLGQDMAANLGGTSYNTEPLTRLQANAESPTQSPWAQLQSQLARTNTGQALSQNAGNIAGQTAQAKGNLAMSGGLSSGAGERATEMGETAGIAGQQGIQNQGNQALLNIGATDAATKQRELEALPGMETQAYQTSLEPVQMMGQANAQDVAAQMAGNQALNNFNMQAYGNQASMYGAGQTANAQEQTAQNTGGIFGGGGFLGTGSWLCSQRNHEKKLSAEEKILLNQFLHYSRKIDPSTTQWYLTKGNTLVTLMKASGDDWRKENTLFIETILDLLRAEKIHESYTLYKKHVFALCDRYWPRLHMGAA